ncbi:sensor histidine kinase [Streptomyces rubellomurinus]|uniref:histidine kinase n=1 Tax=Streptomyces rubellomurinus (strain ATCC 31215) TaxID=359131 RepID=A0A0F2TGW0_STRR3|nr:sensor histidine kinase [Streptomyces rubellomurinus]KJS62453.1 histidine kinase [Streptomyces rubellomurinus]
MSSSTSSTTWREALVRSLRRPPWSREAWRDTRLIAAGIPLALPVWLGVVAPSLLMPVLAIVLTCTRWITRAQRGRLHALLGVEVPPAGPGPVLSVGRLRIGVSWRQLAYHLLVGPSLALGALGVVYLWGAGLVLSTLYAWVWLLPMEAGLRTELAGLDVLFTVVGVVLLVVTPWLATLTAWLEVRSARALLGPNRAEALERRVEEITESRAGLVDAVDAERRRIERDLHDGAQQRLTSLAMNLGLARRTLKDCPPDAMQVIVAAHEEAQAAIDELRDLVRGLHPAVLEDRGLDAALSGVAARAPLPVRLDVDLSERIAPTVEAVAYFTVSEALTNVAKHARASAVDVSARTSGGKLRLVVTDDGVGGADATRGTGLTGLRQRAASVDGTLSVLSPLGGPTTITVELPCVL